MSKTVHIHAIYVNMLLICFFLLFCGGDESSSNMIDWKQLYSKREEYDVSLALMYCIPKMSD